MMRRLVERHHGILPLDTAEGIWRVIIATFTYVQAPFSVHADLSAGDALMRDSARFHFGFTVPLRAAYGRGERGGGGVRIQKATSAWCRPSPSASGGAWWNALEFDSAPKIIARLPFIDRANHPAGLPVFVVSRAAAEAMVTDVEVWSVRVAGWTADAAKTLGPLAEVIAVPDSAFDGAALLDLRAAGRQHRRDQGRAGRSRGLGARRPLSSAAMRPAIGSPAAAAGPSRAAR